MAVPAIGSHRRVGVSWIPPRWAGRPSKADLASHEAAQWQPEQVKFDGVRRNRSGGSVAAGTRLVTASAARTAASIPRSNMSSVGSRWLVAVGNSTMMISSGGFRSRIVRSTTLNAARSIVVGWGAGHHEHRHELIPVFDDEVDSALEPQSPAGVGPPRLDTPALDLLPGVVDAEGVECGCEPGRGPGGDADADVEGSLLIVGQVQAEPVEIAVVVVRRRGRPPAAGASICSPPPPPTRWHGRPAPIRAPRLDWW